MQDFKNSSKTEIPDGGMLYTNIAGADFQDGKKSCLTNDWFAVRPDLPKGDSIISNHPVSRNYRRRLQLKILICSRQLPYTLSSIL